MQGVTQHLFAWNGQGADVAGVHLQEAPFVIEFEQHVWKRFQHGLQFPFRSAQLCVRRLHGGDEDGVIQKAVSHHFVDMAGQVVDVCHFSVERE